jgi:hypothetical protein
VDRVRTFNCPAPSPSKSLAVHDRIRPTLHVTVDDVGQCVTHCCGRNSVFKKLRTDRGVLSYCPPVILFLDQE